MKKLSLLLALVGMIFLTSCEKENTPSSLAGTTWRAINYGYSWNAEISFTATHVTYNFSSSEGRTIDHFEGTYTYNAPDLSIEVTEGNVEGASGHVKGHDLTLHVHQTLDLVLVMELKKR